MMARAAMLAVAALALAAVSGSLADRAVERNTGRINSLRRNSTKEMVKSRR